LGFGIGKKDLGIGIPGLQSLPLTAYETLYISGCPRLLVHYSVGQTETERWPAGSMYIKTAQKIISMTTIVTSNNRTFFIY